MRRFKSRVREFKKNGHFMSMVEYVCYELLIINK